MAQLIDQVAFFEKYNIKEEDFSNTKLTREELLGGRALGRGLRVSKWE